jgi:hypothetical protein
MSRFRPWTLLFNRDFTFDDLLFACFLYVDINVISIVFIGHSGLGFEFG